MNIESVVFNDTPTHKGRTVSVKYFLSDPTNSNTAYNLVTTECTGTATVTCANTTKFGNLRFYLAYQNMVGQQPAITEFSAYNNGGNAANVYAYKGTNDGKNHYTAAIPLPDDIPATAVASGTARVVSIGQIKEAKARAGMGDRSAARGHPQNAGQRCGATHLSRRRPVGHAAATARHRRVCEVQRLPRRAGNHIGLQYAGRGVP